MNQHIALSFAGRGRRSFGRGLQSRLALVRGPPPLMLRDRATGARAVARRPVGLSRTLRSWTATRTSAQGPSRGVGAARAGSHPCCSGVCASWLAAHVVAKERWQAAQQQTTRHPPVS